MIQTRLAKSSSGGYLCYTADQVLSMLDGSDTESEIEEDQDFPLPRLSDCDDDEQDPMIRLEA